MTETEMREYLRAEVARCGSQRQYAKKCGLCYLSIQQILRKESPISISDKVATAVGFRRVVTYEPIVSDPIADTSARRGTTREAEAYATQDHCNRKTEQKKRYEFEGDGYICVKENEG